MADKHPNTVAEFDYDGETYEIDDLSISAPEMEHTYAIFRGSRQVADFFALVEVQDTEHLIRLARETLDADSDHPQPHSGEVTSLEDVMFLVARAVEEDPSLLHQDEAGRG